MDGARPGGVTLLRFERGVFDPPASPVPIELFSGHLHYYRYARGGEWTTWEPAEVLARWNRVPRRLPGGVGHGGPAWLALREGYANGLVAFRLPRAHAFVRDTPRAALQTRALAGVDPKRPWFDSC